MLGLPSGTRACLFDMDGVLTDTAGVHAAAWKEMFDEFLSAYASHGPLAAKGTGATGTPAKGTGATGTAAEGTGATATAAEGTGATVRAERRSGSTRDQGSPASDRDAPADLRPFDAHDDYDEYVDGKPRLDGVRDFLASRNIDLPEGGPDDPPTAMTVHGLGARKNDLVLHKIHDEGVEAYPGSVAYVRAASALGLSRAVVSSSSNCSDVLRAAGIINLFDAIVDGHQAEREHMAGKPAPDTYIAAARALGVEPAAAAVFEDALAGVAAGRAGRFGFVVGVDRVGQAAALREHGADRVVQDLGQLIDR